MADRISTDDRSRDKDSSDLDVREAVDFQRDDEEERDGTYR